MPYTALPTQILQEVSTLHARAPKLRKRWRRECTEQVPNRKADERGLGPVHDERRINRVKLCHGDAARITDAFPLGFWFL